MVMQASSPGYCGWYSIALANGLLHPLQKQMDHWWSTPTLAQATLTKAKGVLFLSNLRQLLGSKIPEHFENELGPIISAFADPSNAIEDIRLQPVFWPSGHDILNLIPQEFYPIMEASGGGWGKIKHKTTAQPSIRELIGITGHSLAPVFEDSHHD